MVTSNSYNFSNTSIDSIIRSAYEKCGIVGTLSGLQGEIGRRNLNELFTSWANKDISLYMEKEGIIPISYGQSTYLLPNNLIDTLQVTLLNIQQELGGNAFSSAGGSAAGCFNPNSPSPCIQTSANGYISYNYGFEPKAIQYIGIQTHTSTPATYHIVIEYSYDNVNWLLATDTGKQTYIPAQFNWFVNTYYPSAICWRIREVGGSTLNIYQINFATFVNNQAITRIPRDTYIYSGNRNVPYGSNISGYLVDRKNQSTLILYPSPNVNYSFIYIFYKSYIEDVDALLDSSPVPQRIYMATVFGLAELLCIVFAPDRLPMLSAKASEYYALAAAEDTEKVPLTLSINDFWS